LIYAVGVLLFVYVPPTYLFLISFNPGLLPRLPSLAHLSLKWYALLFAEERMIASFQASVVTGVTTAVITTVLAVLASLAHLRSTNRSLLFNTVVFPMFVPGVIQGLSLAIAFKLPNITPSLWTVTAGHVLWAMPFAFVVILTNLSALRGSLIEAAQDLGASPWQTFRDIIFPLVSPGITSAALFAFLLSFNEYIRAYFLVGAQDTLPIYMFGAMNAGASPTIYALAGTILIVSFLGISAALLALIVRQRRAV
jgi:spermidine/putrescine transport system permease protein